MKTTQARTDHETITQILAGCTAVLLVALTAHAARSGAITASAVFCLATLCLATGYFSAEVARQTGSEPPLAMAFGIPFLMLCNAHVVAASDGRLVFALIAFSGFVVTPCVAWLQGDLARTEHTERAPRPALARRIRKQRPAHRRIAHASCQVCGERLTHDVVSCAQCETPHHADCFRYAEKCSTFGCGCRRAA